MCYVEFLQGVVYENSAYLHYGFFSSLYVKIRILKVGEEETKGRMLRLGVVGTTYIILHYVNFRRGHVDIPDDSLQCTIAWE